MMKSLKSWHPLPAKIIFDTDRLGEINTDCSLGIEDLERLTPKESLRGVHECVFGVLEVPWL